MSFRSYSIKLALHDVLLSQNIREATPIQALSFEPVFSGQDVYIKAQTGSGKTLAYLLPRLSKLETGSTDLQILIIAPTHELASQIHDVIKSFASCFEPALKTQLVLGDSAIKRQQEKLKKKPHIIVGSLGRIKELIQSKKMKTHKLQSFILDEADRLLNSKHEDDLQAICQSLNPDCQKIFVSATDSDESKQCIEKLSSKTQWITAENSDKLHNTTHAYYLTQKNEKLDDLRMLIKACKPTRAIIFAHHQDTISFVQKSLEQQFPCLALLGNLQKLDRQKVLNDFKNGKVKYLITSDIAARGLDIPDVSHIFQYDLPTRADNYLHRAGRTGRMGKDGGCISLVTNKELPLIAQFEKEIQKSIEALN